MPTRPEPAQVVVTGTDPAANTEFSDTVPASQWWGLVCATVALVQGITQTPQPVLVIDDGATTLFESFGCTTAQAVSTTCRYTWGIGMPISGLIGATTNVHAEAGLPAGLVLCPGYRIRSTTVGIGANSDYGAPVYLVRKYVDFPGHLF